MCIQFIFLTANDSKYSVSCVFLSSATLFFIYITCMIFLNNIECILINCNYNIWNWTLLTLGSRDCIGWYYHTHSDSKSDCSVYAAMWSREIILCWLLTIYNCDQFLLTRIVNMINTRCFKTPQKYLSNNCFTYTYKPRVFNKCDDKSLCRSVKFYLLSFILSQFISI